MKMRNVSHRKICTKGDCVYGKKREEKRKLVFGKKIICELQLKIGADFWLKLQSLPFGGVD